MAPPASGRATRGAVLTVTAALVLTDRIDAFQPLPPSPDLRRQRYATQPTQLRPRARTDVEPGLVPTSQPPGHLVRDGGLARSGQAESEQVPALVAHRRPEPRRKRHIHTVDATGRRRRLDWRSTATPGAGSTGWRSCAARRYGSAGSAGCASAMPASERTRAPTASSPSPTAPRHRRPASASMRA